MKPLIREAKESDSRAISSLLKPLSETYIISSFTAEGKAKLLASMEPEKIREYINADFKYFVALSKEELVGVVAMRSISHLYHLFVSEPQQGKGLGRRLWEIAQSSSLEMNSVEKFTVNSSINAREFYEKLGFEKVGEAVTVSGVIYIPMELYVEATDK